MVHINKLKFDWINKLKTKYFLILNNKVGLIIYLFFSAINGKLIDNIEILHHFCEFIEANFAIVVLICLDDCSVHQLLQLHIIQIVAHHHFEDSEKFSIRNISITIYIVDLECES